MKKLIDYLKKAKVEGELGIEIELEGRALPMDIPGGVWKVVADYSLRNGAEYVLRKPIAIKAVSDALDLLTATLRIDGSKIDYSFRTSVHVHLNVQQYTYVQLLNLIYTYLLIEEPMMEYCGEVRKSNRFCLRLRDAEYFADILLSLFQDGPEALERIPANKVRYAALNLESLAKFGSVEFRGMRGTCDKDIILNWCTAISELGVFAKSVKDPKQIYEIYSEGSPESFFRRVITSNPDKFLTKDFTNDFQQSFSLSLDLPFMYKEYEEEPEKEDQECKIEILMNRLDVVRPAGHAIRKLKAKPAVLAWDDLVEIDRE